VDLVAVGVARSAVLGQAVLEFRVILVVFWDLEATVRVVLPTLAAPVVVVALVVMLLGDL
jgi:hypothetical protein